MTAPIRNTVVLFDAQVNAGITSKKVADAASTAATGNGGWVDISGSNGGVIGVIVTNGVNAPGAPLKYVIQVSDVNTGVNITELRNGAGDTAPAATGYPVSVAISLRPEFKYARVLSYGHTTNSVGLRVVVFLKA